MFKSVLQSTLKKYGVRFLIRTIISLLNDYLIALDNKEQTKTNVPPTPAEEVVNNNLINHM